MPNIPKNFEYDLTNLHSVVSWSKKAQMVYLNFQWRILKKYANMVTAGVLSKYTVVKKHFSRGGQLIE